MNVRRGRSRLVLAATAMLCGLALTGCAQTVVCDAAVVGPHVEVDVTPWVKAHPDSRVQVCLEGRCSTGTEIVTVFIPVPTSTGQRYGTPYFYPDFSRTLHLTIQPLRGSTPMETIHATATLSEHYCGELYTRLQLSGDGRVMRIAQ